MTTTDPKSPLTLENAVEHLLDRLPDLRGAFDKEADWWSPDTPPPYVVFEDVARPFVEKLLAASDETQVRRAFDFLEELAAAADSRLHDLLRISVLTPLTAEPALLARAERYAGPQTTRRLREVGGKP